MGQEPDECPSCGEGDKLQKQFASSFNVKNKNTVAIESEQPVGVLTKEYIEENRRILEQEKKLAKEEEYEPSWNNIECIIETTDAAIKNQTASSSYKPALLDCGIKINVPPFIESGEKIILDTRTLEYVKRVN